MSPLRQWRNRLGLSQGEAADAIGLSVRGYQNYESGKRRAPKPVLLAAAAVLYGLKPIDLQFVGIGTPFGQR